MQDEISSVSASGTGPDNTNQTKSGAGQTSTGLPQRGSRKNVLPPVTNGFKKPKMTDWNITFERDIRERTKSAVDIINDTPPAQQFADAAARAAGEAEALRVRAEKAQRDAVVLKQLAETDNIVIEDDNVVLIREYSDLSLNDNSSETVSSEDFAKILANLDKLSKKQLIILSSTVNSVLETEFSVLPKSILLSTQQNVVTAPCAVAAPVATSYASVAKKPANDVRNRGNSRIRANPTQGGVRTNRQGGKVDYDRRVYIDPSGKRFRMQTPRQKSQDRLKAESQIQTIVRRLREFADANCISKEKPPIEGSDLDKTYRMLLGELQAAKDHMKLVKAKSKETKSSK